MLKLTYDGSSGGPLWILPQYILAISPGHETPGGSTVGTAVQVFNATYYVRESAEEVARLVEESKRFQVMPDGTLQELQL